MIIKNSLIIFMALLIGGILNFASISIFSRLLTPAEYGLYALAVAASMLAIAFMFQWISHSFIRMLPQKQSALNKVYVANFLAISGTVSLGLLALAAIIYAINAIAKTPFISVSNWIWILVPAMAIIESLYRLICAYTRLVREKIWLYAIATIARSILYIALGYWAIQAGFSYIGLLAAVMLSFFIPAFLLICGEYDFKKIAKKDIQHKITREIMSFGFPIIAVTSIVTAIASTDNFLLTFFIGSAATGQFAVALDLVTKSLIFLIMIIHKTTYPLLVKSIEFEGIEAAKTQYRHNTILLFALAIPACAGLSMLSTNIAHVLLGEEFRDVSSQIIPYITLIAFTSCAFQFYLTPAFHLAKKNALMIAPVAIAFISNIIISSILIPKYGINGAITGSFCAYIICFTLSFYFVKKIFPLPFPLKEISKITLATALMALAIWPFRGETTILNLITTITLGGAVYAITVTALNVGGYKTVIMKKIKQRLK